MTEQESECECGGRRLRASEADGPLGGQVYCERGLSCQRGKVLPREASTQLCDPCAKGNHAACIGEPCRCEVPWVRPTPVDVTALRALVQQWREELARYREHGQDERASELEARINALATLLGDTK